MNFFELMRDDSAVDFGNDSITQLQNQALLLGALNMLIPVAKLLDLNITELMQQLDANEVLVALKIGWRE